MDESASQRWLAYELHDGLLQWIIGARMQLVAAKSRPEDTVEHTTWAIVKAIANLDMAMVEARELIGYLEQQSERGEAGIAKSLMRFIKDVQRESELNGQTIVAQIDLDELESVEQEISNAVRWNLLRISQQAIRNAIQHAGPTRIEVGLRFVVQSNELELLVEDCGRGFDADHPSTEARNFGLSSMSHRARLIGAKLEIKSKVGAGCRVQCKLPIPIAGGPD